MDVSIVIVNYNTCQMTSMCIDSIVEKTKGIEYEIILVDNASIDNSKSVFEADQRVRYVYNTDNIGFGRANNIGMEMANGKYIFLLNSDTLLVNNAIGLFYNYAERQSKEAFYGCWLEDLNGNHINSGGDIPTIKSILWNLSKSYIIGRHEGDENIYYSAEDCYEIGYITGADMFFSRSIFERIGGFDPHFFMYSEETDWQRRALKVGIKSYIIKGPQIIHLEGGSQKESGNSFNVSRFARYMKSRNYYILKEYSKIQYWWYRLASIVLYTPKLLIGKKTKGKNGFKAIGVLIKGEH